MNLPDYIRSFGKRPTDAVRLFAAHAGVTERATLEWLYTERLPRRETAQRIISRANGAVTWASIYGA